MPETDDVLSRLRAILDGDTPPQTSRYEPPPREEPSNKEMDGLKKENRHLKRDIDDLKRRLESSDQSSQAKIASHRDLLSQATEALSKSTSELTLLKSQITSQSSQIHDERQKRQAAEGVAQGCKVQQSQLAKEKHELEQRVKRFESVEVDMKRLADVNKQLESSNASLKKQITNGAGFHGTRAAMDGLQEKAKTAELKVHKLSDQLRHVRLQNDALRIQVEDNTGKASFFYPSRPSRTKSKSQNQGRGPGQIQSKHLIETPPQSILRAPSTLSLGRPQSAISQILEFLTQNIQYIFEHLPPFIKSLIGIYRSFTIASTKTSSRTVVKGDETVRKLFDEKGAYKNALKEKDLELQRLSAKLEDQKQQNRAYVEQFKAQERESQRYRSKQKERAFLKVIPILPPTPSLITVPPSLLHKPRPDLEVLSERSFSDDLAQLADLTGRNDSQKTLRKKDRFLLVEDDRDPKRYPLDQPELRKSSTAGSFDDIEKQIRQMTIKKPDPYGDLGKAFGLDPVPPKEVRSMVATVEDEEERPKRVVRKGSPINSNAERYGEAYA